MSVQLRDGRRVDDPRLDAIFDKDPRNRNHPVTAVAPAAYEQVDREWPRSPVTDQGGEGACVGHGYTGWCAACTTGLQNLNTLQLDAYALDWYHETQHRDEWRGCALGTTCTIEPCAEAYGGTSVKAGGDTGIRRGLLERYTWAFGLADVLKALATVGPVVFAVPWLDGMYQAPNGKVQLTGKQVGAHCIKADAVYFSTEEVEWQNSWGLKYGVQGRARISFADLDRLLQNGGESCVPIAKQPATTTAGDETGVELDEGSLRHLGFL